MQTKELLRPKKEDKDTNISEYGVSIIPLPKNYQSNEPIDFPLLKNELSNSDYGIDVFREESHEKFDNPKETTKETENYFLKREKNEPFLSLKKIIDNKDAFSRNKVEILRREKLDEYDW